MKKRGKVRMIVKEKLGYITDFRKLPDCTDLPQFKAKFNWCSPFLMYGKEVKNPQVTLLFEHGSTERIPGKYSRQKIYFKYQEIVYQISARCENYYDKPFLTHPGFTSFSHF